jgi:hypothetical protein
VENAFYEFTLLADGDDAGRRFYLAHELEVGQRYFIYVSTLSGLYRYDMNDVLEVIGHCHQAPIVRFLFKGKGITNIQGEKLSEEQFIIAVNQAAEALAIGHDFFMGFANIAESRYQLYIELLRSLDDTEMARFAHGVDEALCRSNVEYQSKRQSERLKPLTVVVLPRHSFERYRDIRLAEGAHLGQMKWLNLSDSELAEERLRKLMVGP